MILQDSNANAEKNSLHVWRISCSNSLNLPFSQMESIQRLNHLLGPIFKIKYSVWKPEALLILGFRTTKCWCDIYFFLHSLWRFPLLTWVHLGLMRSARFVILKYLFCLCRHLRLLLIYIACPLRTFFFLNGKMVGKKCLHRRWNCQRTCKSELGSFTYKLVLLM